MADLQIGSGTEAELFDAAYRQVEAEILAVPEEDTEQINLDLLATVSTVIGAWPRIRAQRAALVEHLPKFDIQAFDKLETYALALGHTHIAYLTTSEPPEALEQLYEEGVRLREFLVLSASAVAFRNWIDPQLLKELKGANGYRNLASDLLALTRLFRTNWDKLAGKVPVTEAELVQASTLGARLVTALGVREQGTANADSAARDRQRAFTLFITTYEEVRLAIQYLHRKKGNVEEIIPSLYPGKAKRKPQGEEPEQRPDIPELAQASEAGNTAAAPEPLHNPIPPGMPGASPFLRN